MSKLKPHKFKTSSLLPKQATLTIQKTSIYRPHKNSSQGWREGYKQQQQQQEKKKEN